MIRRDKEIADRAKEYATMTDSQLRLRCGELTAQEIRTIRAVISNILGYAET